MRYGTDMIWSTDGQGNYRPEFINAKTREFIVGDDEFSKWTGKDYNDTYNPMRDWYFLSDEDQKKIQRHDGSFEFKAYEEDQSGWNNSRKEIDDWRIALNLSHEW